MGGFLQGAQCNAVAYLLLMSCRLACSLSNRALCLPGHSLSTLTCLLCCQMWHAGRVLMQGTQLVAGRCNNIYVPVLGWPAQSAVCARVLSRLGEHD